jgi:hypothetical protein
MMDNVVSFRPQTPSPDFDDLSAAILAAVSRRGVDANVLVAQFLENRPGLNVGDIHAAVALSHKVISTFHRLVLGEIDRGGAA